LKGWYGHDKSSRFLMDNSKSFSPPTFSKQTN
jgi:hypothetical protein